MKIYPHIIIRTPLCASDTSFDEDALLALLRETWFREAIYIASPALFKSCEELIGGKAITEEKRKKIIQSLAKYYVRMAHRCTPFGLFASCSRAKWGDKTEIVVKERPVRRTRLDMFYLCRLVQHLLQKEKIQKRLRYFPNSSIYYFGDEIRYIETTYVDGRRSYRITAVDNTEYARDVLKRAAAGATLQDLRDYLITDGLDMEEVREFIESMSVSQLLVAEWEPAITGKEYMFQVIDTLENISRTESDAEIQNIIKLLRDIEQHLQLLDTRNINEPAQYRPVIDLITRLGVPFEEEKIFQVDAVKGIEEEGTLDSSLQQSLYDALYLFENIIPAPLNPRLDQFKKMFRERYEDREVLLAEVLDTETGIGFADQSHVQESPLLEGMILPPHATSPASSITSWDHYWLKYLVNAQVKNQYTITLNEKDIDELRTRGPGWTPSLAAVFRLTAHGKIFVEYAGGSSAVNLAGRFTYADEGLHKMVNEIAGAEQSNNRDVILAEIVHLPESRTGNVLQHHICRDYEIPYLAKPAVEEPFRIGLGDLWLSIVNDRIVLRSKKLDKEIIPRLSNAHNFSSTALPVYNLLCQLQTQQLRAGASFSFGAAENYFRFLPRVEYKNCIVHAATWLFDKKDIQKLTEVNEREQPGAFAIFNAGWNLPRYFVLIDGDNELLVDSNNELLLKSFIRLIKNRQSVRITEYLGGGVKDITGLQGRKYNSQFIAIFIKDEPTYQPARLPVRANLPIRFTPGSEWLYTKLYCGFKTADRVISEMIAPMAEKWLEEELILKWFFIRYHDPHFHLRVRFLLKDPGQTGKLMDEIHQVVNSFNSADFISKVQVDTYEREAARYGYDTMELSESIFFHDSIFIAELLRDSANTEELRWQWAARVMDELTGHFGFSDSQKLTFMLRCRDGYAREFNVGGVMNKQLDKRYRILKNSLSTMLQEPGPSILNDMLQRRLRVLQPVINQVLQCLEDGARTPSLEDFLSSHIHMMLNRLFVVDARVQEWVLYDFLSRHYQSVIARNNRKLSPVPTSV